MFFSSGTCSCLGRQETLQGRRGVAYGIDFPERSHLAEPRPPASWARRAPPHQLAVTTNQQDPKAEVLQLVRPWLDPTPSVTLGLRRNRKVRVIVGNLVAAVLRFRPVVAVVDPCLVKGSAIVGRGRNAF